ncbi:MAG: hypothetical protein JWP85_253 [Rhodoglobus sp.]|nr:hypothetical protein [Rhodoglobus sp.]
MDDTALRRAKRPRTILAGPYGHPVHGLLVTIPIGAWTASLVFDIVAAAGDEPEVFSRGAEWLIGIGLVGAVLAAIAGLMDLSMIAHDTRARKIALTHMTLNLSTVALFLVSLLLRLNEREGISVGGVVLSVVALTLLAASGYLGGELAYRYGVRVADEDTQRKGFDG